jgi:hypothetical protein
VAATPTLATIWQLQARIPGEMSDGDVPRALAALDDASAWIRTEAGTEDWLDADGLLETVPPVIVSICCAVARRIIDNPAGLVSETVAGYSYSQSNATTDVYLTKAEKAMIHKIVGGGGLVSVPLEGPYTPPWPPLDVAFGRGYDGYTDWYTAQ